MNLSHISKPALAALLFAAGCATHPTWEGVKFGSHLCPRPDHGHASSFASAQELRSVNLDMRRYRPVQERPGQNSELAVAVAISGGGERAGNFGLGALLQLERLDYFATNNLLQEVDYFSTVSGGGLPVAGYLSGLLKLQATGGVTRSFSYSNALYAGCTTQRCPECPTTRTEINGDNCLFASMRANYHSTLLQGLFHPTTLLTRYDRGDVLESHWDDRMLGLHPVRKGSFNLGDVFVPAQSGLRPGVPYWVANATVLGNGAIFPFTPDVIERYAVSHYNHQIYRQRLNCAYDFPLAVGLKASASFPAAIPATTLKLAGTQSATNGQPPAYLQLSDGGLADNLGVSTAVRLLQTDEARSNKVLIVIDAYADDGLPMNASAGSPTIVDIVARTTDIALDSWRGRYREMVEKLCAQLGIKTVFLSFEDLESHDLDVHGLKDCTGLIGRLAEKQGSRWRKYQRKGPGRSQPDWFRASLREIGAKARATPTSLSLSAEEQDILVTAGRLLICIHEDEIRAKVGAK